MKPSKLHIPARNASPATPACAGNSCPTNPDLGMGAGITLQWYYWPPAYKEKLKTYFNQYWQWMQVSWPLYRQYKDSGFGQKPAGFDERFGHNLDPQTQAPPKLLPTAFETMLNLYTHVLYDPAATVDLYLKVVAMQLVLELGDFLEWKLGEYNKTDLAIVLDGRNLFTYFPAGSVPWDIYHKPDKEGYEATGALPAPPLVTMNFLFREGILRDTRFDTVSQFLEWQRFMQHAMGDQQSLVGECGKEFSEVYWGIKGEQPLDRILHGTVMACRLVPQPGSDSTNTYYSPDLKHYTGGCGGTGQVSHRVLSLINIPAERLHGFHAQMRFVVERAPFEQMLAALGTLPEPAIDDGLPRLSSVSSALLPATTSPSRSRSQTSIFSAAPNTSNLVGAYLDHNDNPYGMAAYPEIPVKEALLPQVTYERWFKKAPEWLSPEQESKYREAHLNLVSLRPKQLTIARLPLYLFWYYCFKQDAGKTHGETELYNQLFASKFTVEEMEASGFWPRFEQKLSEQYGGCEGVPSPW